MRFLQRICEDRGLLLAVDVRSAHGGDSESVVRAAGHQLAKHAGRREIRDRLVLLDRDRLDRDIEAGRDAQAAAADLGLEIVFQEPNLEGVLLRLHSGQEGRRVHARAALTELRRVWPEYDKPPTVDQLTRRFNFSDLDRAARHDTELRRLLSVLGL